MIVRRAGLPEIQKILILAKDIFPESEISISPKDILFVAEKNGRLAGFAHLQAGKSGFVLQGIGVAKEFREMGAGSALLDAALSYCREKGASEVALEVEETNLRAARVYAKHGFVVSKQKGKTVLMQKAVHT